MPIKEILVETLTNKAMVADSSVAREESITSEDSDADYYPDNEGQNAEDSDNEPMSEAYEEMLADLAETKHKPHTEHKPLTKHKPHTKQAIAKTKLKRKPPKCKQKSDPTGVALSLTSLFRIDR